MDEQITQEQRALETLASLAAILGGPTLESHTTAMTTMPAVDKSWSTKDHQPRKEMLVEPMISCPPFRDPSSIVIADQETFEYDLLINHVSVSSPQGNKKMVRFCDSVSVVTIPSHRDIDPEIVDCAWSSAEEIHQNAQRNAREWMWDCKDWVNATEEDQMIYVAEWGEYIHPATWWEIAYQEEQIIQMRAKLQEMKARKRKYRAKSSFGPFSINSLKRRRNKTAC